jgi:hypothetical protein
MPVTDEHVQKVEEWMRSKGVSGACSACGNISWKVYDIVVAPVVTGGPEIDLGTRDKPKQMVPMVQIICENCAHVTFFAARQIGIA